MIDFPIMPEKADKLEWLLGGILYFFVLVRYSRWALNSPSSLCKYPSRNDFVFFFFIFCLFSFFWGDWVHLQTIVRNKVGEDYVEGFSIEITYHYLANLLGGNYLLFRSIVWGTGILLLLKIFKKADLDPYRCLFFLFGLYIMTFAYTRTGVALSVFYWGFILLLYGKEKKKLVSFILGTVILISSFFFHRSLIVLIVMTPLAFIPIKKKTIPLLFICVVVFSFLSKILLDNLMDALMNAEELSHRMGNYEKIDENLSFSLNINGLFFLWEKAVFHIPFWVSIVKLYKEINKGGVSLKIQGFFRFSLILYFFSMLMLVVYGPLNPFYYRYEGMLYIPITIMINYLFQYRFITQKKYTLIFWIFALPMCKDFLYRVFVV